MLKFKRFCSLRALELFTTEHNFICLHRHQSFLFLPPAPAQSWPYLQCAWSLSRRAREGGREQSLAPWQRSVSEPAWGHTRGRSPRCRRTHGRRQRGSRRREAAQRGRGRCPRPPWDGTASAAGAASALTCGKSDPGSQRRPLGTGDQYPRAAPTVPAREGEQRQPAVAALPGLCGRRPPRPAIKGWLAFLGARRANRRQRGRKREAGAGWLRGQGQLSAGAGGRGRARPAGRGSGRTRSRRRPAAPRGGAAPSGPPALPAAPRAARVPSPSPPAAGAGRGRREPSFPQPTVNPAWHPLPPVPPPARRPGPALRPRPQGGTWRGPGGEARPDAAASGCSERWSKHPLLN